MTTPNVGRKWWGWGAEDGDRASSTAYVRAHADEYYRVPPRLDDLDVPVPRVTLLELPAAVRPFCTTDRFERVLHSRGRSFVDQLRNLGGNFNDGRCVDIVAFPRDETEVRLLLGACNDGVRGRPLCCVPWGGGSSVSDGLGAPADTSDSAQHYAACVCCDMRRMDRVLAVDTRSMTVRVQAGVYGPALEAALRPHGLTLRHYPQSFEFSTAGGWVATRGAGHFATRLTHIDDVVQAVRVCTPSGHVVQTRTVPGSGAGPSEHRQYIGMEGVLGIITEVTFRVQLRPARRAKATVFFLPPRTLGDGGGNANADADANADVSAYADAAIDRAFITGARVVQSIVQSGLLPANLRLIDGAEADMSRDGWVADFVAGQLPGRFAARAARCSAMLLIGFEGSDHGDGDVDAQMRQALAICADAGGVSPAIDKFRADPKRSTFSAADRAGDGNGNGDGGGGGGGGGGNDDKASEWNDSFKAGGYRASHAAVLGLICETFESAVTWDRFEAMHAAVMRQVRHAMRGACQCHSNGTGADDDSQSASPPLQVSCRLTHVYPDGVAPYWTCLGFPQNLPPPSRTVPDDRIARWEGVKRIAMEELLRHGGTSTHHHAVGRMHRAGFERERGSLFGASLAAQKRVHDPKWILNPGVLIAESMRVRHDEESGSGSKHGRNAKL